MFNGGKWLNTFHIPYYGGDYLMSNLSRNWNTTGSDPAVDVLLTEKFMDEETGVEWLSGSVELPYNTLGLIAKPNKGDNWADKDVNQKFDIDPDQTEITLWYVHGFAPVADKSEIELTHTFSRYLYFEYEKL